MKKYVLDLIVAEKAQINANYVLLKMTHSAPLPEMVPGQFAELRVDGDPHTFLRRPISIHYYDAALNQVWFLIQLVGSGTRQLGQLEVGATLNAVLPLGNGFTLPTADERPACLLIGGGVGIAPLLQLGKVLKEQGHAPTFLLGARSAKDLLQRSAFEQLGEVYVTTEDGSEGEQGYVTQHSLLQRKAFTMIYTCGPKPMMVSVAKYATAHDICCEVSLENKMACGLGACLCCVEKTQTGHVCVCKEGPVFNIKQLLWQI